MQSFRDYASKEPTGKQATPNTPEPRYFEVIHCIAFMLAVTSAVMLAWAFLLSYAGAI